MELKYEWSEIFPVSETQLEEWKKDPKKPPLLIWALNTKIIDPEQFKNWAYKHYSIPKLKSKFLEKIEKPLAREYKQLLDLNILPMRKNEGILYVACVEPIKNLPVKEQIQFLVANSDDLQKAIQNTKENLDKPDEEKEEEIEKPIDPPQGMVVPKNYKPNTDNIPDGLNIKLTKNLKPNKEAGNAPEGLNIKNIKIKKESTQAPDGLAVNIEKLKKNKLSNPDLPDNLNIPGNQANRQSGSQAAEQSDKQAAEQSDKQTIEQTNKQAAEQSDKQATEQIKPNVVKLKPKKQQKLEDRKVDHFMDKNLPKIPKSNVQRLRPITPKSNSPKAVQNTNRNIDIEKLDPEFLEEILRSLDNKFDKKILFFVQDGKLLPVHWDKSFVPKNTKPLNTLDEPGIFRIAFRSKDKYFGEIYKNEINDLFFDGWMNGQYPSRITVLALMDENKDTVFGLFLGVHKLESTSLDTLDMISKDLCHKLSQKLSKRA